MKKTLKILGMIVIILLIIGSLLVFGINWYIQASVNDKIITKEQMKENQVEAILILGCQVRPNGTLSLMLEDRLQMGLELYSQGVAKKLIVSGDHGTKEYDEVNAMKQYLIEKGVPSQDIFMDHAGFSTYESIYRAKDIFGIKSMVIVTQEYHLYRSLYIAKSFEIQSYGVSAKKTEYAGQFMREIREILARDKDFIQCIFKPLPTYLGESIPVSAGNGDITNDK